MNFIINGFHKKIFFPLVSEVLRHFNVKYAHLTYTELKLGVPSGMEAIYHNVKDLTTGNYDNNWDKVTPLGEDIIERMNDCEVVVLKMMDRLPYELSYDERKRLYLKHLRYWNYIISKNKIDLFLSSSPPHEIYDFIIYCLCKLKKIPTIFFFQVPLTDTVTMMRDWKTNITAVQSKYCKLLREYRNFDQSKILLTGRLKKYFELYRGDKDTQPFYSLKKEISHKVINNLLSLAINLKFKRFLLLMREPNLLFRSIFTYGARVLLDNKLARFRKKNCAKINLSKKYIYLPLHFQPELSTSPLAGAYVNQILIAQMIAYYLPKNIYIYVKENPSQTAIGRSIEFYKELLKIPQVRFVPDSFNTFVLIKNSLAVATATGTVGLEALHRCKPVLMFGHNFYQYAKGIFQIKSNSDCQNAINRILKDGYKPTIKDFKIFLVALEDATIEGYINVDYIKDTCLTDKISNRNILRKLIKEIELVCHL